MSSTRSIHTAARTALLRSHVVPAAGRALTRSITLSAATRLAATSRPLARNNGATWLLTSSRLLHQSSEQQAAVARSDGPTAPNVHTPKHFHDNRGKLKDGTIVSGQSADALSAGNSSSSAVTVNSPQPAETATMQTGDWVMFHPVYTPKELTEIKIVERAATRLSDRIATFMVYAARKGFDLVTGYKHVSPEAAEEWAKKNGRAITVEEMRQKGWIMDEKQWLNRFLFLESVAGVPGMVGGVLRHLRSLRLMKRDGGYIHTLLEEAENERMHLMTFMKIANPSMLLRLMCLGAQGVFFNLFFLAYMLSPRAAHFFVGKLEEEAVKTYTGAIEEIEQGRLPAWKDMPAPEIAIDYWRLPSDAKVLDVIYAVRADEATHRFVNHSLASLEKDDLNPFALAEPDGLVKGSKAGFDRKEATEWAERVQRELKEKAQEAKNERAKH